MFNGIINIYKEPGYTSNDVVAKLRGILHQKKIGHAGTLDPAASGVLPVMLGCATKLSDDLMDHDKTYRAVLLLGVTTDTQDMTGEILEKNEISFVTPEMAEDAVRSFVGAYEQVPPMYSAKKIDGRRLYDLAREGKIVERKPVQVQIDEIVIEQIDLPHITFRVRCSKGTYIRTLCADIGERLGTGGAMEQLTRIRCGGFYIEDAVTLDQVEKLTKTGRIAEKIIPPEEMFLNCLRVSTRPEADRKLMNGNILTMSELGLPSRGGGDLIRVCDHTGSFTAVYQLDRRHGSYRMYKMLVNL